MAWRSIFKFLSQTKKVQKTALKQAAKIAEKAKPIVQTIQAGWTGYSIHQWTGKINDVAAKVTDLTTEASDVADKTKGFIPAMQVIGESFADSVKIFTSFNKIATAAEIGANLILAYQGIQVLRLLDSRFKDMATSIAAQTAIIAQREFPQYVHSMIQERITQTSLDPIYNHWFFVFHPANDWYPGFYEILRKKPCGPEFCGYTNQIDTAFVFMLAARRRIKKKEIRAKDEGRQFRPTKLHLLIPAYQPILIHEALKIPEEIGDFVMEGRIGSNGEFVWFNLPENQRHYVQDIGQFQPPEQGWLDWVSSTLGLAETPTRLGSPRELGARQASNEDDGNCSDLDNNNEGNQGGSHRNQTRHSATPIHHQYRTRRERRPQN